MKLSVGIPGDLNSLERILDSLPKVPNEVYFSLQNKEWGSCRTDVSEPCGGELSLTLGLLKSREIDANIIMNAACYGNRQFSSNFLQSFRGFLQYLSDLKIAILTIADPFLIKETKRVFPGSYVVVSSVCDVRTPNMVDYFNELGVSRIILSPDLNRNPEEISNLASRSEAEIELILNEGCLLCCPYKQAHFRYNAHKTRFEAKEQSGFKYINLCGGMCLEDPKRIKESPFIRPEDLEFYESLGIFFFKVAGRNMGPEWIIRTISAYQNRSYEGNVVDLLNSKEFLSDRVYIPNKTLKIPEIRK